jgi:hypothetical protein
MFEDIGHRLEGFEGTIGRPWEVEDEARTDGPGDSTRETAEGVHRTHGFGKARSFTLDHRPGCLRSEVGR